jgi:hypothetical protein
VNQPAFIGGQNRGRVGRHHDAGALGQRAGGLDRPALVPEQADDHGEDQKQADEDTADRVADTPEP